MSPRWKEESNTDMPVLISLLRLGLPSSSFLNGSATRPVRSTSLPDAALLIDALGPEAKNTLLDWYCALQLREYRRIFRATDEAGGLDNVSRRFAWFRRVLRTHEEDHRAAFLPEWNVSRALVERFTKITREDVKSVLVRERGSLRVETLLESLNATMDFEKVLSKKFAMPVSPSRRQTLSDVTKTDSVQPLLILTFSSHHSSRNLSLL